MLFIRTSTTKNGRRAQGILHPCRCWESWVRHHHTGLQSAGNPSVESVTPFLSSKLLQDFLVRRQLCALFLLSNRKDVKTPFCTVGAAPSGSCLQLLSVSAAWRGACSSTQPGDRAAHVAPGACLGWPVCGSPAPPHATVSQPGPCTVM